MELLIYEDEDGQSGLEAIRRWCIYRMDVTERGRLTERNKVLQFQVLVTTFERVMDCEDFLLRELPFVQVIVDDADIEAHRLAIKRIPCKRVICSTSNVMPQGISYLKRYINCIDPEFHFTQDLQTDQIIDRISSFEQLIALKKLVGPFFLKNFVLDAEKIFGNIR